MQRWLVIPILLALLLSGCAAPTSPTAPTQPPAGAKATPAGAPAGESGKIVLRVWAHQNNSFNQAHQNIINKFMEANPGVEVKFETFPWDVFIQTIQTALPSGQVADLIEMPGGMGFRYAKGGQLLEVPPEIMTLEKAQEIYSRPPWVATSTRGNSTVFLLSTTWSTAAPTSIGRCLKPPACLIPPSGRHGTTSWRTPRN